MLHEAPWTPAQLRIPTEARSIRRLTAPSRSLCRDSGGEKALTGGDLSTAVPRVGDQSPRDADFRQNRPDAEDRRREHRADAVRSDADLLPAELVPLR